MKIALLSMAMMLALSPAAMAADSGLSTGVGGRNTISASAGGHGLATTVGVSSPGAGRSLTAGVGIISSVNSGGSVNRGTGDGFNTAGVASKVTASKGRNTMETVPGRSPTYLNVVAGKSASSTIGGIGH